MEKNGKGKYYEFCKDFLPYGPRLIYEGEYLNGEKNGKGKNYYDYNGKLEFEGEYLNGERNGKGKEYDWSSGKLNFEGVYLNGKKMVMEKNIIGVVEN